MLATGGPAQAGFKKELKKRKVSPDEYSLSSRDGQRYYDLASGSGREIQDGDRVVVHFDAIYRGIDAVSSRSSRLLGGNRTIAEPFEFVAGASVSAAAVKLASEGAGGLFSGAGGPKPPPVLSTAVVGMKQGGKRSVLVDDPALGYGAKGLMEIPGNSPFELQVEVLRVTAGPNSR